LIYWGTTNLWTFGQQYYVIKRNPTPGSPAYNELMEKRAKKGLPTTSTATGESTGTTQTLNPDNGSTGAQNPQSPQRKQPKKRKPKK